MYRSMCSSSLCFSSWKQIDWTFVAVFGVFVNTKKWMSSYKVNDTVCSITRVCTFWCALISMCIDKVQSLFGLPSSAWSLSFLQFYHTRDQSRMWHIIFVIKRCARVVVTNTCICWSKTTAIDLDMVTSNPFLSYSFSLCIFHSHSFTRSKRTSFYRQLNCEFVREECSLPYLLLVNCLLRWLFSPVWLLSLVRRSSDLESLLLVVSFLSLAAGDVLLAHFY